MTSESNTSIGVDVWMRALQMTPWRLNNEENWVQFWRSQDVILTCMEEFAEGWFRRRHTATATALDTALRCCEAETPFDVAREMLTWSTGSMQRVMEDGLSCQKCFIEVAKLTPHADAAEAAAPTKKARPPKQTATPAAATDKAA